MLKHLLEKQRDKTKHQHCLDQDWWYGLGKVKLGALVTAEGWLKEVWNYIFFVNRCNCIRGRLTCPEILLPHRIDLEGTTRTSWREQLAHICPQSAQLQPTELPTVPPTYPRLGQDSPVLITLTGFVSVTLQIKNFSKLQPAFSSMPK